MIFTLIHSISGIKHDIKSFAVQSNSALLITPTPYLKQFLHKMWEGIGFKQRYICHDKFRTLDLITSDSYFYERMLAFLESQCKELSKNVYFCFTLTNSFWVMAICISTYTFASLWQIVFELWQYAFPHVVTHHNRVPPSPSPSPSPSSPDKDA